MVTDPTLKRLALYARPHILSVFARVLRETPRPEYRSARHQARVMRRVDPQTLPLTWLNTHHRVGPDGAVYFRTDAGSWLAL